MVTAQYFYWQGGTLSITIFTKTIPMETPGDASSYSVQVILLIALAWAL